MICCHAFESFQPMKNGKTLLNSQAVQKQPVDPNLPSPTLWTTRKIFLFTKGGTENAQSLVCQGSGDSWPLQWGRPEVFLKAKLTLNSRRICRWVTQGIQVDFNALF